jgi:hypothetical protein
MHKPSEISPYFSERYDATDRIDLTTLYKCTIIVHQLAYDMTTNMIGVHLKLWKSTALECLEYYCVGIIDCFDAEFLRRPTIADTQHLLAKAEERWFLGMLWSIDCMHQQCRNCLIGWQDQLTRGDIKYPTIILADIVSHDRWICHTFFRVVGSNNDTNVLNQSPLFVDIIRGYTPEVFFIVNDCEHHMGYYLIDDIYPS